MSVAYRTANALVNLLATIYLGIAALVTVVGYSQHTREGLFNASIVGIAWPYFLARG